MLALLSSGGAAAEEGLVLLMHERDALCPIARVADGRIESASFEDVLRLGFTQWTLQVAVDAIAQAETAAPSMTKTECSGEPYVTLDSSVSAEGFGIAYGGMAPRSPQVWLFEKASAANYAALSEVLANQYAMPAGTPLAIRRVVVAELDGDENTERLIEASWQGTTAVAGEELLSSGYDLLILADAPFAPRIVAGEAWVRGTARDPLLLPIEVLALPDVDGDGLPEIVYLHGEVEAVLLQRDGARQYLPRGSCFNWFNC